MKIAVSGKGGVGKTTISAYLAGSLAAHGRKVLAIDSDPSPHLARVLGFPGAESVRPIAEMRELLLERSERDGPFYRINPKVDDLPARFMLESGNIRLMVLGAVREGGAGCACADNAVLKALLNILLLSSDEDILVDMEAGLEPLGRGTIATMDHLIVVVQPYAGSLETARRILSLAQDLEISGLGVVVNNVKDDDDIAFVEEGLGMRPVGIFPVSDEIRRAERSHSPVFCVSDRFKQAAEDLLRALGALP